MMKRTNGVKKLYKLALLLLIFIFVSNCFVLAPLAYSTGDDYPSKYKNKALDAVVDEWNFYNRECTSFVAWCLNSRNGVSFTNQYFGASRWGNAKTWGTVATSVGISVNSTPAVGSVAWWNIGNYGHVAWVKTVKGSNVVIDEYNWSISGGYGERTIAASSVTGFIHIKDITTPTYANLGEAFYAKITNTYYNLCLTNDSDNVSVRTDTNAASQWWHFIKNTDGTYKIVSMKDTSKCLDVHLSGTGIKTNIKVATDNGGNAQKWAITGSQGKYVLSALCTDCVIDVDNITLGDGANVWTWTSNGTNVQLFTIEPHNEGCCVDLGQEFDAKIKNPTYDMYFTNDSVNVCMKENGDSENQWWHFERCSDYSYKIISYYDNLCLDVHLSGTGIRTNIKVANDNGGNAQKWYIYKNGNRYVFKAKCTQCVIDVDNGPSGNGANLQTYSSNGTNAQLFDIEKVVISNINFELNEGEIEKTKARTNYDSINGGRGTNQLIIFTNGGSGTGTNQYGVEVLIDSSNKVIDIKDHIGNATVPLGGFILSGHGEKASWLIDNVKIGDYANYHPTAQEAWIWTKNGWLTWTKKVLYGNAYGELPIPFAREGYTFKGWYTAATGGTQVTSDTIVAVTSAQTLYAHWEQSTSPLTETTVTKESTHSFIETVVKDVAIGSRIMIATYKNSNLSDFQIRTYTGENISITTVPAFDTVKIMVCNSDAPMKILSEPEVKH